MFVSTSWLLVRFELAIAITVFVLVMVLASGCEALDKERLLVAVILRSKPVLFDGMVVGRDVDGIFGERTI